jgi:6-pyruvoyltetrahydropterin/6-carboxytetrahydropterin synthase
MTTVRIGKTYSFDAAHQLDGHRGRCANLHGHTYIVEVWMKGEVLEGMSTSASSEGMVMDYGDLDEIVKPLIDALDHAFLTNCYESSYLMALAAGGKGFGKVANIGMRTTAEHLAIWLSTQIMLHQLPLNIKLLGVKVSETPKTFAEYIVEVNP